MKLSQMQLVVATVGTFVGIIALNILMRYRSDETFREQWSKIPTTSLSAFRDRLVEQEQMVNIPTPVAENSEDADVDTGEPE